VLAHAQQGRRTLLIDGDLRRPRIHRRFDLPGTSGLSNVLTEGMPWRSALVRQDSLPTLDIQPAGPPSRRAIALVGAELTALMEGAAREYDLVILDTPPLLGFPEPAANGRVGGRGGGGGAGRTGRTANRWG
jgi:Mrp family chromosome partitioning ATPase